MAHRKTVRHFHDAGHLHELTFSCYRGWHRFEPGSRSDRRVVEAPQFCKWPLVPSAPRFENQGHPSSHSCGHV